jgi:hypothetical protein
MQIVCRSAGVGVCMLKSVTDARLYGKVIKFEDERVEFMYLAYWLTQPLWVVQCYFVLCTSTKLHFQMMGKQRLINPESTAKL